jgi:serpin B
MRHLVALPVLLLSLSGACGAGDEPAPWKAPAPAEVVYGSIKERAAASPGAGADVATVVAVQNAFTLRLLAAMRPSAGDRNLAIGPYSIHQVLAMLFAGARGTTADEMKTALGFQLPVEQFHAAMNALDLELGSRGDAVTLAIANRTFAQKGQPFLPAFLDVLTRDYGAPLAVADFAGDPEKARGTVNDWVKQATREKISELLPPGTVTRDTMLVLANAMYLDAPWKNKLDATQTAPAPFTLIDGAKIDVPTMHAEGSFASASSASWQAIELPYRGDKLAMVVVVPRDLRTFEAQLTPDGLIAIVGSLRAQDKTRLAMPKFTFSFHASLVQALEDLGLASLFAHPDLSGVTGDVGPFVQALEHEVFIKVNEAGTEASAATAAVEAEDSEGPAIAVDRPFLFVIRDRPTGAILFVGRVLDPTR